MVNLNAGAVQANRAMVSLGPGTPGSPNDAICVYNGLGTINVVIDVNGWYGSLSATAPGYQFQALPPTRICDTRLSTTSCLPMGPIGSNQNHKIPVAGDLDIPAFGGVPTVVAVIANLTAIAPTVKTVLIVYPANLPAPNASDVNVEAGEVLPNLVVVQLDTLPADLHDGEVALYNGVGSVNAVIDIEGWFQ